MTAVTNAGTRLTPAQNRFYYITMTFGAIFCGWLIWIVIDPPAIYRDLWGKYPSKYEAYKACNAWRRHVISDGKDRSNVNCIQDVETRQYLGHRNIVEKRFRF